MKAIIMLILTMIIISCSSYNARRSVSESETVIRNGVYQDREWTDELIFKRFSWYSDATMKYDILLSKLDSKSGFSNWLETDANLLGTCSDLYIGLFYSSLSSTQRNSYLLSQLTKQGFSQNTLLTFSSELKAHQNFIDWGLGDYKIIGLCRRDNSKTPVTISIPGFKNQVLSM